jgi:hypothetical protein
MARPRTLDLDIAVGPDAMAVAIANRYTTWKNARAKREQEWSEVRNFVFATDTSTTSNNILPWKNKTVRPKLCQIRDNLHANYMAALFPNAHWFSWEAGDESASTKGKRKAIESYMRHIFANSQFEELVSRYVYDYIDYGNAIGDVEYVNETAEPVPGVVLPVYSGPRALRISPMDIVFDITASSFHESPKITRTILSFGQLEKLRRTNPEWAKVTDEILNKIRETRGNIIEAGRSAIRKEDLDKAAAYTADGFSSLYDYYTSDSVEVLEFEGDLYDNASGAFYQNHVITILDRTRIVRMEPAKNWLGRSLKQHCGWRLRPDNLMAMGPLDNLVGLQYRINHLENLKADVWDLIAFPIAKHKGYVEDWKYGPMERIYMDQDADVEFLRPDTTVLNADAQIDELENTMEAMAGAPRQAMGIRTPGEKTAFEVQSLDNASSRIFQSKTSYFERNFVEPMMNTMLEVARRNLTVPVVVKSVDDDTGVEEFLEITQDDLTAKGRLVARGSRHFAARAQLIQNLSNLAASGMYVDESVKVHLSGKRMAELIEENLGLSRYNVYQPNIRIVENMETQEMMREAQEHLQMGAMTPVETNEEFPDQEDEETNDQ